VSGRPRSVVVLTGAGISAESGLRTFRASDGLWYEHRIEDVATPEGFRRDPALVHRFYNERRSRLLDAQPNEGHRALAEFEGKFGGEFLLVTQNIDDLHERAGSPGPVHMHGELLKKECSLCGAVSGYGEDLSERSRCGDCGVSGGLRPHVVWFGEMPRFMDRIADALASCDLFVSIGTSGQVYPAAGFVSEAKAAGARCVELNLEPSAGTVLFDESLRGPATRAVPDYFGGLLAA